MHASRNRISPGVTSAPGASARWLRAIRRVCPRRLARLSAVELAIAQMGIHLVFFLHISSAPDQTSNILARVFGIFVVGLLVFGSMIIMAHLNHNMMPMDRLMQMQR